MRVRDVMTNLKFKGNKTNHYNAICPQEHGLPDLNCCGVACEDCELMEISHLIECNKSGENIDED